MELEIISPRWLFAYGDGDRVETYRSVQLHDDDEDWLRVREYIADHGLVLVASQQFADDRFFGVKVDVEVYTSPALRNAVMAGETTILPVCLTPEMFE